MDETKTYIKMSDCPEIQGKWKPEEGDFYVPFGKDYISGHGSVDVVNGVCAIREEKRIEYLTGGIGKRLVFLPRQDQIQEMMGYSNPVLAMEPFAIYRSSNQWNHFKTWEQLWLAFYMWEHHKKIWNGKGWVAKEL